MSDGGWSAVGAEWRAHWRVGLAAFLTVGLSFGAFNAVVSIFIIPLQEAFGWSRAQVAFAQNAGLAAAIVSPFLGRMVDVLGARKLMLGGCALSVLLYLGLSMMNGTLLMFYTLTTCAAVVGMTGSGLTCSRVVSEVFIRSRGFSLAVVRGGMALTATVLPGVFFLIISTWGWRAGYLTEAALVAFVSIPAIFFWIGRTRADEPRDRPATALPAWGMLFRDRRVLILFVAAGLGYAPSNSLLGQLHPILVSKGVEAAMAAKLVGLTGLASIVGALVTGALVDRMWAPGVALVFAIGSAAGAFILASSGTLEGPMAMAAILLIGVGLGAEIDLVAFLVARYFGVAQFSSIYGVVAFSLAAFGAAGSSILGIVYDRAGNYDPALYGVAAAFLAAGLIYLTLGRYPTEEGA